MNNWQYSSEIPHIQKAKRFESAQEEMYKSFNDKTSQLEVLKIQINTKV